MDFSYQTYVKKLEYKPYAWPPDISLAGLHSRCSEPGKQNPVGVSCPCCGYKIKNKIDTWIDKNIYQDFRETGAGIPTYFGLLRFYNLIVFIIFIVNAPYFTYASVEACSMKPSACVGIGKLYYIDFQSLVSILKGRQNVVTTLMTLQTIVFYILLVANNASIFYISYISRKCKDTKRSTKRYMTLLVENIPLNTSEEELRKRLVLPNGKNPTISSVTFVKELSEFNKLFKRRVLAFFELKAMYIQCLDPKLQHEKNKALIELDLKFKQTQTVGNLRQTKAIVMFEDHEELAQIYSKYQFNQIGHWWERIRNKVTGKNQKTDVFVNYLPELEETLWVNMGEDHKIKLISKIKVLAITTLLLVACYILFYYPLLFSLNVHSSSQNNLSAFEKIFPTIVALALVGMSIAFRYYMEALGKRRCPKTHLEQSLFVLTSTIMFHLIFYLLVPTFFFAVDNKLSQSVKLFAISSQARTFIVVQIILACFDSVFRLWRMRKMKSLADQRQAFKYPQKYLHQRVQYRDYPIQIKLVVMFKIWSLVLFYSFFVPVITLYVMAAMIALYFLEKRNIYQHYVIRKHLSSELEIKFLNIYINFFCVYECLIYVFNVTQRWQIIAAVASTLGSLLLQLFYWQILKKKQHRRQRHKIQIAQNDARRNSLTNPPLKTGLSESLLDSPKQYDSDYQQNAQDPTYGSVYLEFLKQFQEPDLQKEIQLYLSTLQKYGQTSAQQEPEKLVVIQQNPTRGSAIEMQ